MLAYTREDGWLEVDPGVGDFRIDANATVLFTGASRPGLANTAFGVQIETAPGDWEPLAGSNDDIALPASGDLIDVSDNTVAWCTLTPDALLRSLSLHASPLMLGNACSGEEVVPRGQWIGIGGVRHPVGGTVELGCGAHRVGWRPLCLAGSTSN